MDLQQTNASPTQEMSLIGHLSELRRRLLTCLLACTFTVGLCFAQAERILQWLRRPVAGFVEKFAYFSPPEALFAYLKVAAVAGLALAIPIILAQIWGFVKTGLTPKERSYGMVFVLWGSLQFALGVAFAYYVLLPVSLRFLLGIGTHLLQPVISIERYLDFVLGLIFWCGIIFQLPVVLFLLAKVGIVTSEWLRQQRPYAFLIMVIAAALLTPTTDVLNLVLMAVPMVLLYEVSIWVTRLAIRKKTLP